MRWSERVGNQLPAIMAPSISGFIAGRFDKTVEGRSTHRARTGGSLIGNYSDIHFEEFTRCGQYDWRNIAAMSALVKPGDTIVEVGSNVGTETVSFRDLVGANGSVHAFEPAPANL